MLTDSLNNQLQCGVHGCKRYRAKWGELCISCSKRRARTGTTDRTITSRLHSTQLRSMSMRVATCLPQSVVSELAAILLNLPTPPPQRNVHKLTHAKDRAMYALAWISKQRGPEEASRAILSRAIAVELIDKPTSAPRYRVASIAKAVHGLLKADTSLVLFGRVVHARISLQGRRAQEHLVKMIEKTYTYDLPAIRRQVEAMSQNNHGRRR